MDVISPLPAAHVAFTLALFVIVYSTLFFRYLYFFRKLVFKGPPSIESLLELNKGRDDDQDLPATLNPAQVDLGYRAEMSSYMKEHSKHDHNKGVK